jgi:hypothetical protein
MPCPGDAGAPFGKIPMVMTVLHPTGGVGLVGSAELPQPDSIAANATHTGIRNNIRNLPLLEDYPTESPAQATIFKLELLHSKTPLPPSVM